MHTVNHLMLQNEISNAFVNGDILPSDLRELMATAGALRVTDAVGRARVRAALAARIARRA